MLALRIAVFLLTLSLGTIASVLSRIETPQTPVSEPVPIDHTCHSTPGEELEKRCLKDQGIGIPGGSGSSSGFDRSDTRGVNSVPVKVTKPLRIIAKQKAQYTAEARSNGIEGTVLLRVTFLASGTIGSITTVRGLPYGLTEQAIEAARKMKFEPEVTDHGPRTTTRPVTFTFNIY